jgi:release factor glutamine methyltransferase
MEVIDLLRINSHFILTLEDSRFSVSKSYQINMQQNFIKGVPFAYLTGMAEFYGHQFFINEDVLIPRSETEFLVDILVNQKRLFNRALDVGTGSGVIILSLLKHKVVKEGLGSDISSHALKVAQINSGRLRTPCEFMISDRLESVTGEFDLIVSNPPYIKKNLHSHLVHQKVDEFEPRLALYLEDEVYEKWFSAFFEKVVRHLSSGGVFMMEGHEMEIEKQAKELEALGLKDVKVIRDLAGAIRFLSAEKR